MTTDVNGNPIDPLSYRQMRKPPRPNESSSAVSGSQGRGPASNHDQQDMGNKSDDPTSPTGPGQSEKRKSKKKNSTPGKEIHPEKDPNYVGNISDIDNLVKFINNDIGEKKLKKISKSPGDSGNNGGSATATVTTTTVAAATAVSKPPKKPKDRSVTSIKPKQLQTTGVGESVEDSLTPASETTKLLSSTTSLTSSYSSTCERDPSRLVSESEDSWTSGPDAQKLAKDMGNSSASEKPSGEDEAVTKDHPDSVKNHRVQEKTVETAASVSPKPVGDAKTDANKNDKNHMLPNATKSTAVTKKEQAAETKDGKGKPKSGVKDGGKGDHAPSTDNNKKSKAKPPKIDMKTSAGTASEKSSPAETKKESKVENSKDAEKAKDSHKAVASTDVSSAPQQTPSDFELPENDTFIFTDVDLPPTKEAEFTVVATKKKKRSPTQPATQGQQSSNSSVPPFSQYHYSNKDTQPFLSHPTTSPSSFVPYSRAGQGQGQGSGHYQRSGKRSFTPPPSLKVSRPESITKTHPTARDLSPSAFPVLTSGGSSDPRRRSMENLYDTGQLLHSDKDSDKESTKSLPADKSMGSRGYVVSYANILSKTPRQSVDSSKAESVSSIMEDGGSLEDSPTPTSSMKWKGSPQERRHSIGSAPEELSKTPTGSNLQRTGSQEVLPRDTDSLDKSGAVKTVSGTKGMTSSDSAGSFAGSDADSARGSEAGSETPGEVFASPPPSVAAVEERKSCAASEDKKTKSQVSSVSKTSTIPPVSMSRAPPPSHTVPSASSGSGSGVSVPVVSAVVKPKATQPPTGSRSQVVSKADLVAKTNQLVTKTVNNGHKNKKSVIFCNNSSPNVVPVDICFGGDPVFSNEELECSASQGNTPSADKVAKDKVSGSSVSQPPTAAAAPVSSSSSSSSSDINPSTKPKGPHIARLNGLVSPRPPDSKPVVLPPQPSSTVPTTLSSSPAPVVQGQTISQTVSPAVSFEGPAAKGPSVAPAVTTEIPQSNSHPSVDHASDDVPVKLPKGGVSITIGARIKDKKPECKIFIQPEPTAALTSQARMDAVNFLIKGWNKMEKQLKSDASSVHVYNSQA